MAPGKTVECGGAMQSKDSLSVPTLTGSDGESQRRGGLCQSGRLNTNNGERVNHPEGCAPQPETGPRVPTCDNWGCTASMRDRG